MGRESNDQTVVHSSIALLQERFRQLQRVKEMREEKELFRFFSESDRCASPPTMKYNDPNRFLQSELLLPLPAKVAAPTSIQPSSQITCLSLWPDHSHVSDNMNKTRCLNNKSWLPNKTTLFDFNDHDNESDVDTSLHL